MLNRLDFKRKVSTPVAMLQKKRLSPFKLSTHLHFTPLPGDPIKNGCCRQGDRRPDDVSAQSRATGLEEAAANRRHRRTTANWSGAAAELVLRKGHKHLLLVASPTAKVCLPLLRFTLTAQSLFQIKRQLDKLGELVIKVTYECDPIPLQKPHLEERVKYLLYHLIKRYELESEQI